MAIWRSLGPWWLLKTRTLISAVAKQMASQQNSIPVLQAEDRHKRLLRARYRNYGVAKYTQGSMVVLSIILPIVGVIAGPKWPGVRPYIAMAGLILLLLETMLIDRVQKERIRRGAKLQEQFDTQVFDLPWNRFVCGAPVASEDVQSLSAKPFSRAREAQFQMWYDPSVGCLPLHLARLVCQRTAIIYDARLRRRYTNLLLVAAIIFGVALSFWGIGSVLTFSDLVMTLILPSVPVLTWVLKDRLQHANAASSRADLAAEWDKVWLKALDGADVANIAADSRSLQDAIYQHRERSPLIFDWVYFLLRSTNEDEARYAVHELVTKAEESTRRRAITRV